MTYACDIPRQMPEAVRDLRAGGLGDLADPRQGENFRVVMEAKPGRKLSFSRNDMDLFNALSSRKIGGEAIDASVRHIVHIRQKYRNVQT